MIQEINKLATSDLIKAYSQIINELKERKIIRTKNLIGDMGEYLVVDFYNKTPGLPKLTIAAPGTKSIDAICRDGKRYAIKSTSSNLTGVFYGLNSPDSVEPNVQIFDYVIIALFGDDFNIKKIVELTWLQFLKYKRWHSTMRAWNLSITKEIVNDGKLIFSAIS